MPPYTQTALEQELKRAERLPVGWPWRLLLFSAIVLGTAIAIYLGISLGYKPYLDSQIKTLDAKIAGLGQTVGEEQQRNLVSLYSQLTNIQTLLDSHTSTSKIFDLLQRNTQPSIYYLDMTLSVAGKELQLEGSASNYNVLAAQLQIFRQAPEIQKVSLANSAVMADGSVNFAMSLIFKPDLIK